MNNNIVLELYKKSQTVFTFKEVSLLFLHLPSNSLRDKLAYAVKTKKLVKLRKGIYAKEGYQPLELANRIFAPSYISLETVLTKEGIIFQEYRNIFVLTYLTRKLNINNYFFYFRKIKDLILLNQTGIENKNHYYIANKERAFLDAVFLYKDYHFDNLKPLDWDKVNQYKNIYQSKILEKRVAEYYVQSKSA